MAKRNTVVLNKIRIRADLNDILVEISQVLDISKTDILKLLLNRSLLQLKSDSVRSGGYQNLDFSIKKID